MSKIAIGATAAAVLVLALVNAEAQTRTKSHCAGLDEAKCGSTDGCRWLATKKDGTPIKRKPHCRLSKNKTSAEATLVPPVAKADTTEAQPKAEEKKKSWWNK